MSRTGLTPVRDKNYFGFCPPPLFLEKLYPSGTLGSGLAGCSTAKIARDGLLRHRSRGWGGLECNEPRQIRCFPARTPAGYAPLLFFLAKPTRGGYGAAPPARQPARSIRSPHDHFKLRLHSLPQPPAVGGCQQWRRRFRAEWVRWRHGARRFGLVTGDPLRRWPGTKRRKGRVNDRFATGNGPPRPRHRA